MDIGCGDRLAQHNLQIPAHASNSIVSPYLFPRNFVTDLDSPPAVLYNAILITPYKAKPTSASPSTSCLYHHALRSRRNPTLRATTANHVRQPHQLNVNQRHVHLIEIKSCEETRPGHQLETAQQQHADLT
eukprot:1140064-Pelagomonas_calceolata.AAC.2